MRRLLSVVLLLAAAAPAQARGLLIPTEKKVPPLAMLNHHVTVAVEDQVAITRVEQTFRNHTDRQLEASYVFPVPKGATVRKFTMWVDGKQIPGELVEADKARKIYTDIVRRTQDPGLLEYLGNNLLRLRVFPVPPRGDQKIALSYTSVAPSENGVIEYVYPLRTDGKAVQTLEKFSLRVALRSQHALTNIYSPTHAVTMTRPSDRQAVVTFAKEQALLDRDFQLYYKAGGKDVGLTALSHRPVSDVPGYFLLLISPRAELSKSQQVPRDMVFVLDTSGSMRGKRMDQARNALTYCLRNLGEKDRFNIINFATTVNKYAENLLPATQDQLAQARKWVEGLEATGGTAINDALLAALAMRGADTSRTFTVVFFTDGRPTIGETNPEKILKNVTGKNSANTRIFTFGVGDDVNATMLDALAEQSRALASYVRESEDIEHKVSSLYGKISNPVLANLKLAVGDNVKLAEVYPPQLPDLFHGSQLVVLGRYTGHGHAAVKLTGTVGKDAKEFVYEVNFPERADDGRMFVEDLWARRKVGYLLDQIRANGEKKELVDEVVVLAKRYGITTPYTSYLIVPDAAVPVAGAPRPDGKPDVRFHLGPTTSATPPPGLKMPGSAKTVSVDDYARRVQKQAGEGGQARFGYTQRELEKLPAGYADTNLYLRRLQETRDRWNAHNQANLYLKQGDKAQVQAGKLGVDLSCESDNLRRQERLSQSAVRSIGSRNALEIGGVWIDEAFDAKMKSVAVKAQSNAYFRILERHPTARQVFQLGNHLVWVAPSGTALVIDASNGRDELSDAEIDALFQPRKK
ncbi:MAG: VWA domain-containing protein [Gemmataceae bacterium]|nr:VWA domain-containing protein [Gemmataceae bacterium]